MATNAEVDMSAILMQIFGDLKTRGAASHDKNGAGRQFTGIAVSARMQLEMSFGTPELSRGMTPFSRDPVAMTTLRASMAPAFVRSK